MTGNYEEQWVSFPKVSDDKLKESKKMAQAILEEIRIQLLLSDIKFNYNDYKESDQHNDYRKSYKG